MTGSKTYQLENYISLNANVVIRYRIVSGLGDSGEYIEYDNIQIQHNGGPNANNGPVPMGHWWIDITTTGDMTDGHPGDDPTKASQLILVDHKNGGYTPIQQLSRLYSGLASLDGQTFYAVSGKSVYQIDAATGAETLLLEHVVGDYSALGFAGNSLHGFGMITDTVVPLSTSTGAVNGIPASVGAQDLETIVFTPASKDPAGQKYKYD